MGIKKNPGKFTLHFNLNDPQQKIAVDVLNRQGRQKAVFLTKALMFYMEYHASPPESALIKNQAALEQAIIAVLAKNPSILSAETRPTESSSSYGALELEELTHAVPMSEQAKATGKPGSDAIHKTMAAFRKR